MIRGVIIGHGDFAQAMLSTAERIVGKQELIETISNTGLSCESLDNKVKESIDRNKNYETIVFVDLPGGSCTISCFNLLKDNKNIKVICGVNLPMLLEFIMLRDKYSADRLIAVLIKKGQDNIFQLKGKV